MEIIINFRNSWFSIKLFLSSVWRVWRFWCKRLNHEAQQPSLFLADRSNLQALSWECCRLVYVFSDIIFFFWLNWKIFIFTQFLWLSQTSNQIKMISGNSMTFQISQSCPNPWYFVGFALIFFNMNNLCKLECNYNFSHAACLFNKLINFPAALSTKYTKENFLQVFHVWFSVEYRKCM